MLASIILYIATIIASIVLFVAATVAWLAEFVESRAMAALIVGVLFLLLSRLIYYLSARRAMEEINEKLTTISEVAYAARKGYGVVVRFVESLFDQWLK
ncbi:MAG: hypothetical protein IKY82_00970 [Alistipes sp.]|nr:hypothetical protein [Alistipes sp.]